MAKPHHNDLFSSLVSDLKSYTGTDPLLPWLRGIQKLRGSLPPLLIKEKLPRFLQKCAQNFLTDHRYRNDLRYLRVWIQLMDFVDEPRSLLKKMEANQIGKKHALFYKAYALYFERIRKFEEAEKMYILGVQNLAEPIGELHKSHELFLQRMEQHKKRKARRQEARAAMTSRKCSPDRRIEESKKQIRKLKGASETDRGGLKHLKNVDEMMDISGSKGVKSTMGSTSSLNQQENTSSETDKPSIVCNDETVVKFVDTAIVGKSEAEYAWHHGLVDPTINMKDAMNDINSMFREPLEVEPLHRRKSQQSNPKTEQGKTSGLEVFLDESLLNGIYNNKENDSIQTKSVVSNSAYPVLANAHTNERQLLMQETFKIFVDDEDDGECSDRDNSSNSLDKFQHRRESFDPQLDAFVFPRPNDFPSSASDDSDMKRSPIIKLREDTVVGRFVGSAILDEPEVENACHHGLVEPTINLKEAMDDINSMFGKPLEFVRTSRHKQQGNFHVKKKHCSGFSILPDDDLNTLPPKPRSSYSSRKLNCEEDAFEQTVFTKEAMDDINQMFGRPLDF